jgi:glycine dehydrogenase
VHAHAQALAEALRGVGAAVGVAPFFDTVRVDFESDGAAGGVIARAEAKGMNFRRFGPKTVTLSMSETTSLSDLKDIVACFQKAENHTTASAAVESAATRADGAIGGGFARSGAILTQEVFNRYHTETEMLRYVTRLSLKDVGLTLSMIPLGSCTMKLNATAEMAPVSWPALNAIHPFAPPSQTQGYATLIASLKDYLKAVTGFDDVSLQPNSGAAGEYAGLMAIRAFHKSRGEPHRDVCVIPLSAHGTNPASAVMAGMRVVAVGCDAAGNIDLADLRAKAVQHAARLGALMVTYPSTHGVFEEGVRDMCDIIHAHGGQV